MNLREVLLVDCQAAGATPAHGDLLEIAWALGDGPVHARNVLPSRTISPFVRKLTGWSEALLAESIEPLAAWRELRDGLASRSAVPTVIHYARFELSFLRDLHERTDPEGTFPLDVICLHAIAARLYPDLPRRNLRALSGHLGHSPDVLRRAAGHVEATAFVWNAILPALEAVGGWADVKAWLAEPRTVVRPTKRTFPLAMEKRKSLPDRPGVYRFHRPNGDVLYVGKAASLRKRVSGHFVAAQRGTERALEMLTQAHDVSHVETATPLEAAILETDEIKRLDPPYNVHLREQNRAAWFASLDWTRTASTPDDAHVLGPLPSARAVAGIAAMRSLLEGATLDDELRAATLGVAVPWAPPAAMFDSVWDAFRREHLDGDGAARARIVAAGARLGTREPDPSTEGWNPARVERTLVRTVVEESRLLRRARMLALLADATVTFREPGSLTTRTLSVERAIVGHAVLEGPPARPPARAARLAAFGDAARYDRIRVLYTELARIQGEGGQVVVRVGRHVTR